MKKFNLPSNILKLTVIILFIVMAFFDLAVAQESTGGVGSDGGGGQSILLGNGEVHFLDLVKYDDIEKAQTFDTKKLYKIYYEKIGNRNPFAIKEILLPKDFFTCAFSKFERHNNKLIKVIPKLIKDLKIIITELPLNSEGIKSPIIYFPDTFQFARQVRSLSTLQLKSSSVAEKYQRPIASYATNIETLELLNVYENILLISEPLYDKLSIEDKCGLQVHEALRYLNHQENDSYKLLSRKLNTIQIELLTKKLMSDFDIGINDISATPYYVLLSQYELDELLSKKADEILNIQNSILQIKEFEENGQEFSLQTILILERMRKDVQHSIALAQEGISLIAQEKSHRKGYYMMLEEKDKLLNQSYRLDYLFDLSEINITSNNRKQFE